MAEYAAKDRTVKVKAQQIVSPFDFFTTVQWVRLHGGNARLANIKGRDVLLLHVEAEDEWQPVNLGDYVVEYPGMGFTAHTQEFMQATFSKL